MNFTDAGWTNLTDELFYKSGDGTIEWSLKNGDQEVTVEKGTEVFFSRISGEWRASVGFVTYFGFSLSTDGDQIFAYQTANPIRFIAGIHCNIIPNVTTFDGWDVGVSAILGGASQSALPPVFNDARYKDAAFVMTKTPLPFTGTVTGVQEPDNGRYNCTGSNRVSDDTIRAAINPGGPLVNWNLSDAVFPSGSSNNCLYFDGLPTVLEHPQNSNTCGGLPVNFSVTEEGNNINRQWQRSTTEDFATAFSLTNSNTYSGVNAATLQIADNTTLNGQYYRCRLTNSYGSVYSNPALLTTITPSLPTGHRSIAHNASFPNNFYYTGSCGILAKVKPRGSQPVTGDVTCDSWLETSVLTNAGEPYVQRHYQIIAAIDTQQSNFESKATITLYFSQADFDNYNADLKTALHLPATPLDASGKANLYIAQHRGITGNGSGRPGTYNGSTTLIDPADNDILWNATFARWEVTFDVTGFGGFFVRADPVVLPVLACAGSPVSFTFGGGTGNYQWQESLDAGFTTPVNLTDTGYYSTTLTSKLRISDNTGLDGRYYRCRVSNGTDTVYSNGALLTVTPTGLSNNFIEASHGANGVNGYWFNLSCDAIAKIIPSGANPVSGNIRARSWRSVAVYSYDGQLYVQRTQQLLPDENSLLTTATVTLYFSQADFDNYNASTESVFKLPIEPSDAANNKPNLRVMRYYGYSGESYANTYSRFDVAVIDPIDASIIWSAAFNRWEITFDVKGFGGFFVVAQPFIAPVTACSGLPVSFTLPAGYVADSWQESIDEAFNSPVTLTNTGVYTTTANTLMINDNSTLNGRYYRAVGIIGTFTPFASNTALLTLPPSILPTGYATETHVAGDNNNLSYAAGCGIITKVVPLTGNPVSGNIISKVWREGSHLPYNGQPYVQRHYQIAAASGSTATVTIYFSQAEFSNFNTAPGTPLDLPANALDAVGKSNLRIYKYSGSSDNASGLPGAYQSSYSSIDPADADIVWNVTNDRWEITFNVTGLGGFFIGTSSSILNFCPSSTLTLVEQPGSASYQWQVDDGTGFTNLVNNGRYSGATTASLVILSIPANFYGYKYRCVLNGTDFTMPITIKAVTKWTGDISTDWLDPLNWSCSVIPDAYTDVIIDSNSGRYPVLNTDAIIRSIRLSPGATVLLNTPGNLKINN